MSFKTPHSTVRKRKIQRQSLLDSKTVKKRRKNVVVPEVENILNGMLSKTWTCYSCSPLYKFFVDKTSLRRYSQHLSASLTSEIQREDLFLLSETTPGSTAQFSTVSKLAIRQDEPDSVKISISYDERKKPIEIYFLSVDVVPLNFTNKSGKRHSLRKDFYFLPIMIYSGHVKKPCTKVISWFEKNFDCVIRPMKFNPIDLSWMMSMWTSFKYIPTTKKKSYLTEFIWKLPVDGLGLDTIKFQVSPSSVNDIWESMKDSEDNEMSVECVEKFMTVVTTHLKRISNIKFDELVLKEISTPFVRVQANGRIKMGSTSHVLTVLAHLCCLSAERAYSAVQSWQ